MTRPGNSIPVIPLATIIAAMQEGVASLQRNYAICGACEKASTGVCPAHEEDVAAAGEWEQAIAALQCPPAADERLRGLVNAAPPEEVADLIKWTDLNP